MKLEAEIRIYKSKAISPTQLDENLTLEVWQPSWTSPLAPGKDLKYILLSLFHLLGVFKSRHFSQVTLKNQGDILASCLIIPKFKKWPFMASDDVQFTYVITNEKYRGNGYAWQLIYKAFQLMKLKVKGEYWYVTDSNNASSMRLAEKMGLSLYAKGKRKTILGMKILEAVEKE